MEWLKKEWSNILTVGCIVVAAIIEAWQQALAGSPKVAQVLPSLDGSWHYVPLCLLIVAGISWFIGRPRKKDGMQSIQLVQNPAPVQSSLALIPGIPTLSALQGQYPQVTFNAHEFFRLAYYSPVTAEMENNIKIAAQNANPHDHEAFYARLIGVGLVACAHDQTWAYIFKSQLLMLMEMNGKNGRLTPSEAKAYYGKAVRDYPQIYATYTFDQWVNFMKIHQLLLVHPTDMLEITHQGRDLLKYLAHWGRDANVKVG